VSVAAICTKLPCRLSFPAPEKEGATGREEEEIAEVLNYCSNVLNNVSSTLTIHPGLRGAGECPIPFPIEKDALPNNPLTKTPTPTPTSPLFSLKKQNKNIYTLTVGGYRKLQYL